jgi:hypothetical protein
MAVIFDEAGVLPATDEGGGQVLDEATGLVLPISMFPIGVKVELLINGTWTDISPYVYQRDPIQISGGRGTEGDTPFPATATLTVNNRDGRFSPGYTGGAYYPYLGRNIQSRISATAISTTGNHYSGYRFWGEVAKWPPLADLTGKDIYVQLSLGGPLRRIRSGGGKGSALARYYASLSGSYAPVAYWQCEEDPFTTILGPAVAGGTSMTVTTGKPTWKAISDFNGSAPIGVINNSTWDGLTGSAAWTGDDIYTTPGTYGWICPPGITAVNCKTWGPAGNGYQANTGISGGPGGGGGGGGEFAQEATLAVTPGNTYTFTVQAAGSQTAQTFAGDAATVTAHAGGNALGFTGTGGPGGTGSANTTHFNGGAGGAGANGGGGGGGGGSGGSTGAGGAGGDGGPGSGGAGGAAGTGGGAAGGAGGASGGAAGHPGSAPGGGGGGGAVSSGAGANGAAGKVELVYTPPTAPTTNVIRCILFVPSHGGNTGKVILRAKTSSAVLDHLDLTWVTPAKLRLQGFNGASVQQFDSGAQAFPTNGLPLMVSMELVQAGANVNWKLAAIVPGASTVFATYTGTVNTATVGNVTEVIVAPNADVTKTGIGHISVQYALIGLVKVSKALDGHQSEMGIDRFIRLLNEQALDNRPEFSETVDHWGFETGLAGWTGVNAALSTPTTSVLVAGDSNLTIFSQWPPDGAHSLLITATGETGSWYAQSPAGTNGQPVYVPTSGVGGDIVAAAAEVYTPVALGAVGININWFTSGGAYISTTNGASVATSSGQMVTVTVKGVAPATAAFFNVLVIDAETKAAGTQLYVDNVRVHPRMGPQTRKEYHKFLEEIEDLDQGILKEAKELRGLKYRTRFRLINQTPALTLDNNLNHLADPRPLPVVDDKMTKNHIIVKRHKGSSVTATLNTGTMSVLEPPAGAGRYKKLLKTIAEEDAQLLALAQHLLNLGTVADERLTAITVNLARGAVADLMSVIAGVEIGDRIKIINLPFWYPSATADQLVIGYDEVLGPFEWTIAWTCTPASPYTISAVNTRRW